MRYSMKMVAMLLMFMFTTISYAENSPKVLMVLTSHSELGDTGLKTGFWSPELTHPYYEFKKAGYLIDVASIQGGIAPLDPKSFEEPDEANQRFLQDAELMAKVLTTLPLSKIDPAAYQAIVFAGGSGTGARGQVLHFTECRNRGQNTVVSNIRENCVLTPAYWIIQR